MTVTTDYAPNQVLDRIGFTEPSEQRAAAEQVMQRLIVTVAAWKGGVGKTELAKELAWLLDAVLVDFDWDHGNATRAWGYRHEARQNAPLIDAIESGRTPRPLQGGPARADLVPCHPDWVHNQPETDVIARQIEQWSSDWKRPIVLDTHPGGGEAAYAAIGVANVVLVPVLLESRPLEALEGMLGELRGYPIMIVPSMISAAPANMVKWLTRISETFQVPVTSPISFYRWLGQRQLRMAVSARMPISARSQPYVDEVKTIAAESVTYAVTKHTEEQR